MGLGLRVSGHCGSELLIAVQKRAVKALVPKLNPSLWLRVRVYAWRLRVGPSYYYASKKTVTDAKRRAELQHAAWVDE